MLRACVCARVCTSVCARVPVYVHVCVCTLGVCMYVCV